MKAFIVWLIIFVALYAGLSVPYHVYLQRHPRRVLIAVDTSYPMRSAWQQVSATIAAIPKERYSQFSVITDKTKIHSWQNQAKLGNVQLYGPRDLGKLLDRQRYPEINAARRIYLVTNTADLTSLGHLTEKVILLNPSAP